MDKLVGEARKVVKDYSDASLSTHAASTAYFFFTSLIPVIIIVACIVSRSGITEQDMISLVESLIPDVLNNSVETVIREAYGNADLALTLSLAALVWTASKGISALAGGLNAAYGVRENRSWIKRTFIWIVAVIVLVFLVVSAVYLIFGNGVMHALHGFFPQLVEPDLSTTLVRAGVVFVFAVTAFTLCYTFLPADTRRLGEQIPGALLAAVLWLVFSLGFKIYVDHSARFTLFYGSLATVVIFLLWMYWIFLILLVCGLFNRYRMEKKDQGSQRFLRRLGHNR